MLTGINVANIFRDLLLLYFYFTAFSKSHLGVRWLVENRDRFIGRMNLKMNISSRIDL